MKRIGMLLILFCAYQAGKGLCGGLCDRERLLSEICRFIRFASCEIKRLVPLDGIVLAASERDGSPEFLRMCAQRLRDGGGFHESWLYAVRSSPDTARLSGEERNELERLGDDLGSYDLDGELSVLGQSMLYFSERLAGAQNDVREKSKVYMTCSVLAGAAAVLLLL